MLCQNCKKRQATIHLTEIVNDQKTVVHLCEPCAEKQGVIKQQMSIADFLSGLAQAGAPAGGAEAKPGLPEVRCESCGMTLAEFQKGGRFGCAEDYEAFREHIMPLIEKIHDTSQHVGKVPARAREDVRRQKLLRQLQADLRRAVEREEYERAAELRDRIRKVEEDEEKKEPGAAEDQDQGKDQPQGGRQDADN